MALTTILLLPLLATSSLAQIPNNFGSNNFGSNPFGTNSFGGNLGSFGTGGGGFPNVNPGISNSGNLLGGGNPFGGGLGTNTGFPSTFPGISQQRPRRPLATVRATNKAGDALLLTLEEENDFNNPFTNPFGQQPPFNNGPFGRSIRVYGVFIKAGAQTGVTSQDSLHGTFAMVVTRNGNTDGYCIGTGDPYRTTVPSPFNPFNNPRGRNPFSQFFQPQQQGQIAIVSTPLHASTGTSTIEGKIRGVRLAQIIGRSIHVCGDQECRVKTDLCGIIGRDDYTIEEFAKYKQQYGHQLGGGRINPLGGGAGGFPGLGGTGTGLGGTGLGGTGTGLGGTGTGLGGGGTFGGGLTGGNTGGTTGGGTTGGGAGGLF